MGRGLTVVLVLVRIGQNSENCNRTDRRAGEKITSRTTTSGTDRLRNFTGLQPVCTQLAGSPCPTSRSWVAPATGMQKAALAAQQIILPDFGRRQHRGRSQTEPAWQIAPPRTRSVGDSCSRNRPRSARSFRIESLSRGCPPARHFLTRTHTSVLSLSNGAVHNASPALGGGRAVGSGPRVRFSASPVGRPHACKPAAISAHLSGATDGRRGSVLVSAPTEGN